MSGTYRYDAHPSRRWMWVPFAVAAVFIAAFAGAWLLAGPATPAYAQGGYAWWWFPFPWFFLIPAFFLVFFGLRWFFWGGWGWGWYRGGYGDPAMETLRERFARGEITREQFEQMRQALGGSAS